MSAAQLCTCFTSGAANVINNREFLNKINLFPIPDSDTGNNMAMAFRMAAESIEAERGADFLGTLRTIATEFVMNGQGNSGTIMTYFMNQLAEAVAATGSTGSTFLLRDLAECMGKAGAAMASSMDDPKDGTMLSVMRDSCADLPYDPISVTHLFSKWSEDAEISCAKTPDQLIVDGVKILKEGGVDYDSGAKGFCLMVEGFLGACSGKATAMPAKVDGKALEGELPDVVEHDEILGADGSLVVPPERFCTEFVVETASGATSTGALKAALSTMGTSLVPIVVKGDGKDVAKVHIHTNTPSEVFEYAAGLEGATVLKQKVEDMLAQVSPWYPVVDTSANSFNVLIYSTNSLCNSPYVRRHGLQVVPARFIAEGVSLRDGVEVTSAQAYKALQVYHAPAPPRAHPSPPPDLMYSLHRIFPSPSS